MMLAGLAMAAGGGVVVVVVHDVGESGGDGRHSKRNGGDGCRSTYYVILSFYDTASWSGIGIENKSDYESVWCRAVFPTHQ